MFDFTNDKIEIITNTAEYDNAIKLLLSIILYNAMFNIEQATMDVLANKTTPNIINISL